ncbi:MAG: VWA domain-containing protein [Candidatus Aminicenantes bacterium]|nr:VWA domain-containing protein [Candidatus Aminicenantes bacterium]
MNKKWTSGLLFVFFLSILSPGQSQEVSVISISVPVRVFDNNGFVSDLSLDDFTVYEDGMIQKIDALYLVKGNDVARKQAPQNYTPDLKRHFHFIFYMTDFSPRLDPVFEHFFKNVILPGDSLSVMTPVEIYNLSQRALENKKPEKIAEELRSLVRKDIQMGGSEYRSILSELKRLIQAINSTNSTEVDMSSSSTMFTLDNLLERYRDTMIRMEQTRFIDQAKFIDFARRLKKMGGRQIVFFIYQREFRPEMNSSILNRLVSEYQDKPNILAITQELFQLYSTTLNVKFEPIVLAFSDASILFNLIFMHKDLQTEPGIYMREKSEDIFDAFSKVAQATGGVVDTSQFPLEGIKKSVSNSDSYYLLYYTPEFYRKDGKFHKIHVKVKYERECRVLHRVGYFSN